MSPSSTTPRNAALLGVTYGMGAGALWGLVFLAPELVNDFTPLQLSIGRYLAYGALGGLLIGRRWPRVLNIVTRDEWRNLAILALTGSTLYYILLSAAIQWGGIAMTSLIVGFLPVIVTIIGSREHGAVALRKLTLSLLLCVGGTVCISWQALNPADPGMITTRLAGLLCAIGALASWTIFAILNNRCLIRLSHVSAHDWSLLTGVLAGLQTALLIPVSVVFEPLHHSGSAWLRFAVISVAVASLASVVGNGLWNRMSRLLPLTLAGQMVLFETLFALLYGFLWDRRLPTALEAAAFLLVVLSVTSCISVHRREGKAFAAPQ